MYKKYIVSILFFFMCCNISLAHAAKDDGLEDIAYIDFIPLGFSSEKPTYWFGQYGNEEGIDVARLNILDLETNRYVDNTPIISKLYPDWSEPYEAWKNLSLQHAEFLKKDGVLIPGVLMWAMAPQQIGDGTIAEWRYPSRQHGQIKLEKFDAPQSENNIDCKAGKLFKLYYKDKVIGLDVLFYQDEYLPKSRGCATDYRLRAIYTSETLKLHNYIVIIISVYQDYPFPTDEGQEIIKKRVSQYIAVPLYVTPDPEYYKTKY